MTIGSVSRSRPRGSQRSDRGSRGFEPGAATPDQPQLPRHVNGTLLVPALQAPVADAVVAPSATSGENSSLDGDGGGRQSGVPRSPLVRMATAFAAAAAARWTSAASFFSPVSKVINGIHIPLPRSLANTHTAEERRREAGEAGRGSSPVSSKHKVATRSTPPRAKRQLKPQHGLASNYHLLSPNNGVVSRSNPLDTAMSPREVHRQCRNRPSVAQQRQLNHFAEKRRAQEQHALDFTPAGWDALRGLFQLRDIAKEQCLINYVNDKALGDAALGLAVCRLLNEKGVENVGRAKQDYVSNRVLVAFFCSETSTNLRLDFPSMSTHTIGDVLEACLYRSICENGQGFVDRLVARLIHFRDSTAL